LAPKDEGEADEAAIFSQYATRRYSIRTRRWKLIEEFSPKRSTQLYDLLNDPLEKVNLADRKRKKVAAFQSRLSRWREGLPKLGTIHETQGELPEPDMERLKSLGYIQ
jgi:arylsulfatase A-like enzyme